MTSAMAAAPLKQSEHVSFESWLFQASPFGAVATAGIVFAVGFAGFLLVSALSHYALVGPSGLRLDRATAGFVSPLLMATGLAMRRYADSRQKVEAPAFAAIVSSGTIPASALLQPVSSANTLAASAAGALAGMAVAYVSLPAPMLPTFPAVYAWQSAMIVLLCVLFARGAVAASRNWRRMKLIIEQGLKVDLLHADRLAVIGHQTARLALVWFINAAIVLLYFIGGDPGITTLPILVVCAGIGLWIFLHPMTGVHYRVRAAKSVELDRVRDEIGQARSQEAHDVQAAARLPGLIAYEARIQAVREWPFDQTTLIRVATYVLIPAIPWFGQALVAHVVERLAH